MTTPDINCELKEAHSEIVSGINDVNAEMKDCHQAREKASESAEQRRLATKIYHEKRDQANLSIIETMHKLMEGQDAKRKATMMANASQPDCQEIIDELQLHHAKVQNIISESLLSPSSGTKSLQEP